MNSTPALPTATDPQGLTTITLEPNQGPMVVLDAGLIDRIEATLRAVAAEVAAGRCRGLVLASGSSRVFVAGADLKSIQAMSASELDAYLARGQRVFGMLCALGCPTVAAINGAALGGGLELAMHCDGLVAAAPPARDGQPGRPYPIGLPEAGLCICPGWGGTNLLPARLDPLQAIARTCEGRPMTLDEARTAGVLDGYAAESEALLATAKTWLTAHPRAHLDRADGRPLRWIGRPAYRTASVAALAELGPQLGADPRSPAGCCLAAVRAGLEGGWESALEVERRELNRLRHEPAGEAAIRAFFEKSAKK